MKYFEKIIKHRLEKESGKFLVAQRNKREHYFLLTRNLLKSDDTRFKDVWEDSEEEINKLIFVKARLKLFDELNPHKAAQGIPNNETLKLIELLEEIPKDVIKSEPILFNSLYSLYCAIYEKANLARKRLGSTRGTTFINQNPNLIDFAIKNGDRSIQYTGCVPDEPKNEEQPNVKKHKEENYLLVYAPQFVIESLFYRALAAGKQRASKQKVHDQRLLRASQQRAINWKIATDFLDKHSEIEQEFTKFALGLRGPFTFKPPKEITHKQLLNVLYTRVNTNIKKVKNGKSINLSKVPTTSSEVTERANAS